MVKTGAGESEGLIDTIRDLEGVTEAHIVAGAYDIIAEVSAETVYGVLNTSSRGIQGFTGVEDTKTYISMDS
jgi:DNA-binding Lrp family transcriptional regulator